ncbi:MAG TPA: formate dehydrogenase accessory sulfurtransferase FdhD [Saprospiraceae bacterium]|nr:formate dehydrogenase accessory sulfurtransferase FdhD [Saprospiraceae bacterium]HMQ85749.1 formate dehydrogenase accessory sulfurtransferase FdhD [Saprospiraceae bacterium]
MNSPGILHKQIQKVSCEHTLAGIDTLAIEAPLEIQIQYGSEKNRQQEALSVTMRTPGEDEDLALGFLFTEGILGNYSDVKEVRFIGENTILVALKFEVAIDSSQFKRHFYTTSSCGVCGKGAIELLEKVSLYYPLKNQPQVSTSVVLGLQHQMAQQQQLYLDTGGIHAAALVDKKGHCQLLREDVGRHNALDKLIGSLLKSGDIPLRDHLLFLSGRAGFELIQKAAMVGLPIVACVGAPSSLAVELAETHDITLIGFLKHHRFNIYCGAERILLPDK